MAADFISLIGVGVTSFFATNIDDLFILMAFFANRRCFPISQVVLGQYVGMGALLAVGIAGSLIALVIPNTLIGLIGIFPIAIGIKEFFELRKNDHDDDDEEQPTITAKQPSQSKWIVAYLPFLTVAAVTFSGGEEIVAIVLLTPMLGLDDAYLPLSVSDGLQMSKISGYVGYLRSD